MKICDYCEEEVNGINILWCTECSKKHFMCDKCFEGSGIEDRNIYDLDEKEKYV